MKRHMKNIEVSNFVAEGLKEVAEECQVDVDEVVFQLYDQFLEVVRKQLLEDM